MVVVHRLQLYRVLLMLFLSPTRRLSALIDLTINIIRYLYSKFFVFSLLPTFWAGFAHFNVFTVNLHLKFLHKDVKKGWILLKKKRKDIIFVFVQCKDWKWCRRTGQMKMKNERLVERLPPGRLRCLKTSWNIKLQVKHDQGKSFSDYNVSSCVDCVIAFTVTLKLFRLYILS